MGTVNAGVDLITFSGDKLLGGPQAGIILGKKELIQEIKAHPLTRALRIDKLTLAALEAVLWLYKTRQWQKIPVIAMLTKALEEIEQEALTLAEGLELALGQRGEAVVLDDVSPVGGGSMPLHEMPTKVVGLKVEGLSAEEISQKLRSSKPPIVGRIKRDTFLFDLRSLQRGEKEKIIETVEKMI